MNKCIKKLCDKSDFDFTDGNMSCIKHEDNDCLECIQMYGFYVEEYQCFEECKEHENKKPYESKYRTRGCEKCQKNNVR